MINREESIFPYYFESMFYYTGEDNEDGEDGENNQYKLKNTFTFGIKFFQERRNENNCNENGVSNFVVDKKDENMELMQEIKKLMKDIIESLSSLSYIPIESSNSSNIDIKQNSVSTTNCSVMNNYECLSPNKNNNIDKDQNSVSTNNYPVNDNYEYLSPFSNNSNEFLNNSNEL